MATSFESELELELEGEIGGLGEFEQHEGAGIRTVLCSLGELGG